MECMMTAFTPLVIMAWGVCTKYDGLPFGDDSRHNCPSQLTGVYMKIIVFVSRPSYSVCTSTELKVIIIYTKSRLQSQKIKVKVVKNPQIQH